MAGVSYTLEAPELARAIERLGLTARLVGYHGEDLTEIAASVAESAARRRIETDKAAPDGTPWATWSDEYGKTRHLGQTILMAEGDLLKSLAAEYDPTEARVGSNLKIAAIHQLGGDPDQGHPPIPARPFLGLSDDDATDLETSLRDFLEGLL